MQFTTLNRRRMMQTSGLALWGTSRGWAFNRRPPRILLRSSWQTEFLVRGAYFT